MKKTIITGVIASILIPAGFVFADTQLIAPPVPEVSGVSNVVERQERAPISLDRLKTRGAQLIRERMNVLTANKNAVEANKSLTGDQKTSLVTRLTNNINGLTILSSNIASSTDATTTKRLVESIYTDFRIYGIVIPQVRLEKRVYDMQNHSVKLSDLFLKVQTKIDEKKAKGVDVTAWQKSLEDAKILVAGDMNTLAGLLPKVKGLKPSDYGTTSKMIIDSANQDLKKVAQDFRSVRGVIHDGNKEMKNDLRGMKKDEMKDKLEKKKEEVREMQEMKKDMRASTTRRTGEGSAY